MPPHILIAVNSLTERHLARIDAAVRDWATWERLDQMTPAETYIQRLSQAQVIIGWPKAEWLVTSSVEFCQTPSAGYEAYIGKGLHNKPNFVLCHSTGVLGVTLAEHVIALMMALTRRIPQHVADMRERLWQRRPPYREVTGATMCIVGLGDSGTELARRCVGLGMTVIGVRRQADRPHAYASRVYGLADLKTAVALAEHVVLCLPTTPETQGCFSADVLAAMQPGAFFYNIARGSLVDQAELYRRLASGALAGAGLDVFETEPLPPDSPLWTLDNVIITPHAAGRSTHEFDRFCELCLTNLANYRSGLPLVGALSRDQL